MEDPKDLVDEYIDDDDPGFDLYEVNEIDFARVSKQLADNYGFPDRAVTSAKKKTKNDDNDINNRKSFNPPYSNEEDSAVLLREL